ncbi:ABC transporter ATP-binding protein [Zafaria sp. J156]|uniref:ABC transporter ATP-binding protein n=1 Tax=Zafaria sp. J156 TaxID=3116490 RepID=UPI002E75D460|nr:ABC transporter ATP-binding protein [Zafaria sp. J156]MEE1620922.1 ABC transporter ATP-binding protein [Zafaria sp. J156]
MKTTTPAILAEHLGKAYRGRTAVEDVSLRVEAGEVFGIVGANGSGKTTTVEMIAGLRVPDRGSASVFGLDARRDRARLRGLLGVQLQEAYLHHALTVDELVRLYRSFYAAPRPAGELLELVGLAGQGAVRFEKLSGGQQQRLSIALALAGRPRVVILDELTTGLDPRARRQVWAAVEAMRDEGTTILLVSHAMDEVQRLCGRIAVLDVGRVLAVDTADGLIRRTGAADLDDAFLSMTGRGLEEMT